MRPTKFYMVKVPGDSWQCWSFQTKRGVRACIARFALGTYEVWYGTGGNMARIEF